MKKFLLSLAAFALVSSSAMADTLYELTFPTTAYSKGVSAYNNCEFDVTLNDNVWTIANFNNNGKAWDYIKCGHKTSASTSTITTDFAIAGAVNEVITTVDAVKKLALNYVSLSVSSDNAEWTEVAKVTTLAQGELKLTVPSPAENLYYRLTFDTNGSDGGKTNGQIQISKVLYNGTPSTTPSKTPAGISFAAKEMYAIAKAPAEAVALDNPNGLTVTYSSSDESVVSVDAATGAIMVKAVGTAVISATTPETDEYAEGNASYTVNAVNRATNVNTLIQHSTASGDKIGMAGYLTVTYANGSYIYTKDYLDKPALLYAANNTYKAGDMLAPTYFLKYNPYFGTPEWIFLGDMPEVYGTEDVSYMAYESVSKDNLNEVCYLNNVTFDAATPTAKSQNFTGKLADGTELTFRTQWAVEESVEAGTYNVFGVVGYYEKDGVGTLQFYPISYEAGVTVEFPSSITATSNATESFNYTYIPADKSEYAMNEFTATAETTADNVVITFDVPEGWTGFMHSPIGEDHGIGGLQLRAQSISWETVETMKEIGYVLGNEVSVPADGYEYQGQLFLVKDDKVASDLILLTVTVTKKTAPAEPVIPESISGTCDVQDAEIKSTTAETDEAGVPSLYVTATTDQEAATVTLTVPEGWTGYLVYDAYNVSGDDSGIEPLADEEEESPWVPVSAMLEQGLTQTNAITVAADGEQHEYPVYLVDGDRVNMAAMFYVTVTITKDNPNAVEGIEASETDAVYYNLQGVQVANPANGIFVKVVDGKAVKVVL